MISISFLPTLLWGFSAFSIYYNTRIYAQKVLLPLYLHRGSRIARITNTTKVVHDMCTNMPMFVIPMKLARFL